MDRAIRSGNVDVYVLTDGGCAASFGIEKTAWNCGIPGGDLSIIVNPRTLGGNCCDWRHIHKNDHRVVALVDELQALKNAPVGLPAIRQHHYPEDER